MLVMKYCINSNTTPLLDIKDQIGTGIKSHTSATITVKSKEFSKATTSFAEMFMACMDAITETFAPNSFLKTSARFYVWADGIKAYTAVNTLLASFDNQYTCLCLAPWRNVFK